MFAQAFRIALRDLPPRESSGLVEWQSWMERRFCFIGGLAVQHWGEPRPTRDLDLALWTGFGGEAAYDAREFALARRVLFPWRPYLTKRLPPIAP
jgi:hypothetical protein